MKVTSKIGGCTPIETFDQTTRGTFFLVVTGNVLANQSTSNITKTKKTRVVDARFLPYFFFSYIEIEKMCQCKL